MDSNKIVLKKKNLKTLEKADEIQRLISSGTAETITELDLSHN